MNPTPACASRARVFPVIHFAGRDLARIAAEQAAHAGADGVFLIEMQGRDTELAQHARQIKLDHPGLMVGINHLSLGPAESLARALSFGLDMTWTDRPGVTSSSASPAARAVREQLARDPQHEFFGSVAFKYQTPERDPAGAAIAALRYNMVPTTSGPATGEAADPEKLARMRGALGPVPRLAIASGITPENVGDFLPYVTDVLVSTGISQDFHRFDLQRLTALVGAVRAYAAAPRQGRDQASSPRP